MIQDIKTPISVKTVYNHKKNFVFPSELLWEGQPLKVKSVDLHYTFRTGKTLYHVFSVATPDLYLKLILNTDNLFWSVEQISDGLAD